MDGGSPSSYSVSGPEDPSAAIDRLFLELHDKIPKDARGKLAQLSDEVKKRNDANISAAQTTPPLTPPPSSDQELAKGEEEADEARQSFGELEKGEAIAHCALVS